MKETRLTRKDIVGKAFILPISTDTSADSGYVKVGYNAGVYGWNWSAYIKENDQAWYLQGYRNFPKNAEEI